MLFTEARFYLWLAFALVVFWASPAAWRLRVLLLLSIGYWLLSSLQGSLWLASAAAVTWGCAARIDNAGENAARRSFWFRTSVALLVSMLIIVKFAPRLFPSLSPWIGLGPIGALPLGISYYTFHCLGYLLEVYWGREQRLTPATFGLFVTFFPKAAMGPIERSGPFALQALALQTARWVREEVSPACYQIAIGLFLKFVLSDRIKLFVDAGYDTSTNGSSIPGILTASMFCWQLLYDFFGYSLIAIGTGRLFGIKLTNNFNRPYFAHSISDFWNRWHMSLSNWFQDYLYTPLRFNLRKHRTRALIVAGMTTFLAIGIWHGTGWPFVLLGLVHGLMVTTEAFYPKLREASAGRWLQTLRIITVFFVVAATLVLFRAPTLSAVGEMYAHFFTWKPGTAAAIVNSLPKFDWLLLAATAISIERLTKTGRISSSSDGCNWIAGVGTWQRTMIYALLLGTTWALGVFGKTTFLYNQF